ncbi:MAG: hypothetical protein K9N49_08425 [Candidatus Marinimicrobia bacterium]|nr:hypothetical protein [Candidatus Neomarinimicrobiota bacterium]
MTGKTIDLGALAAQAGVTPEQAEALVNGLVEQVLRGAGTGIEIPGLGRIEQESAAGPGAPLRMVFSPNARMAAVRYTRGEAPPEAAPAPQPSPPPPPPEEPAAPVAPEPPPDPDAAEATISGAEEDEGVVYISFRCDQCDQEIEASTELAGETAACPQCAQAVRIPSTETIQAYLRQTELPAHPAPAPAGTELQKTSTVRIDLPDGAPYTQPVRRTIQIKRRT